jgi:hypothetical protein
MMPGDDLETFRDCRRACLAAVRHALDDDGPRLDDAQIGLLLDGAEVCETSIRFRRRGSTLHARLCAVCVEICERCSQLCEAFADDAVMRACGEASRRCADVYRHLAGAPPTGGAPFADRGGILGSDEAAGDSAESRARRARA